MGQTDYRHWTIDHIEVNTFSQAHKSITSAMIADSQNQQCEIIFFAYILALKLVIRVETRPNQALIL